MSIHRYGLTVVSIGIYMIWPAPGARMLTISLGTGLSVTDKPVTVLNQHPMRVKKLIFITLGGLN